MKENLINFLCYLVENCEGEIITEEMLLEKVSDFLPSDYNKWE